MQVKEVGRVFQNVFEQVIRSCIRFWTVLGEMSQDAVFSCGSVCPVFVSPFILCLMIRTRSLAFAYPGQPLFEFPDLTLTAGEHHLLLGRSGCGKTTLLHLLAGLLRPTSGEVQIADTVLNRLSAAQLDHFRGQHIGIVFQRPHFVSSLSVMDNLLLASHLAGKKQDRGHALQLLHRLGVAASAAKRPHRLSQGEQQRVGIARALLHQPAVVLADEPTSALDDVHALEVGRLIDETTRQAGAALLLVTHDARLLPIFPRHLHLQRQTQP